MSKLVSDFTWSVLGCPFLLNISVLQRPLRIGVPKEFTSIRWPAEYLPRPDFIEFSLSGISETMEPITSTQK